MAFAKEVTMPGDATYRLNPNIKQFALLDLGFLKNNAGAFVLHRALEPDKLLDQSIKLKITVSKDLSGFKMSTVSAGDTARVDINANPNAAEMNELYHYFLDELIQRQVLEKVQ
ncbi:cysteine desulfurase [Eupransor demetentiae]|uniref:Cysteine desulfurase n=1 Tax=Eupransor demetentiae TaxID=3109584 RepID=A0ABP0EP72_9LACO|nr:hypothetical protein R54876_GBNLAHCA_00644 [Lactobacillaceae bacterium LMG 33000]